MQNAAFDLRRPELAGDHKLFVNIQRFADVDGAVRAFRRIVQLHIRRVSGTGVVPAVRGLQRDAIQLLNHNLLPVRLEFMQPGPQRRAHNAAANQQEIGFFRGIVICESRRTDEHR